MNLRTPFARVLAWTLMTTLALNPLGPAMAQISVASGATTMGQAGNGVPVVNIVAPNERGLSHNRFNDYNVGTQGLILNNANGAYQSTQLGGYIVGNPNLQGKEAARLILNEVTGGRPSSLAGYTEIAGQAARLVVANPWGISCNGCGFLNTPRVTLSTGTPRIEDGRLAGFRVDGGEIAIDGAGLNASNIDQFDLITRSAKINAELYAQRLNIIAGRNDVAADDLSATALAADGAAPLLAIDSAALGGMYANSIMLLGTEAGVGVRLAGDLAASAGDIRIDSAGRLTLNRAVAARDVALAAKDVTLGQAVHAGGAAEVTAENRLAVEGELLAGGAMALAAREIDNAGRVQSGGALAVSAESTTNHGRMHALDKLELVGGAVDNRGGELLAGGEMRIEVASLDNRDGGLLASVGGLWLNTVDDLSNGGGLVSAGGSLVASFDRWHNDGGEVYAGAGMKLTGAELSNQGGVFAAVGLLELDLTQSLFNHGGQLAGGELRLTAGDIDNTGGVLASDTAAGITAISLDNSASGSVVSGGALSLSLSGLLDNHSDGVVYSRGETLELQAAELDNQSGVVQSDGKAAMVLAGQLNNAEGSVIAAGDLDIQAAEVSNGLGTIASTDGALSLELAGQMDNAGGVLQGQRLTVSAGGLLDNNAGRMAALAGPLHLETASLLNRAGSVYAAGDLDAVLGSLDNRGGTLGAANIGIDAGASLDNREGLIESSGDLVLSADAIDNGHGALRAVGSHDATEIVAATMDNRGGKVESANKALRVATASLQNENGSFVHAGDGDFQVTSQTAAGVGGSFASGGTLALSADEWTNSSVLQAGKLILNIGKLTLTADGALIATESFEGNGDDWHNDGLLASDGLFSLTLTGTYSGAGRLATGGNLELNAAAVQLGSTAVVAAGGDATVEVAGSLSNQGRLTAGGDLALRAGSVDNRGTLGSAGDLELRASAISNSYGLIFSGGDMSLRFASLENRYADIYSLGALGLAGMADGSSATLVDNASSSIEAAGVLTMATQSLVNRKSAFAMTSEQVAGSMWWVCYDCGGDHHNVDYVAAETFESRIVEDSPAALIQGGAGLTITANTVENRYSTIASGAGLSIQAGSLANIGAATGTTVRTRTWNSGWVTDGTNESFIGAYIHPYNAASLPKEVPIAPYFADKLVSDITVTTPSGVAASAVIQAAGSATVEVAGSLLNDVAVPGAVSGSSHSADTSVGNSAAVAIVTLNAQLPPDLSQQRVDPLALPGFNLPVGENGLFHWADGNDGALALPVPAGTPASSHRYLIETNPALTSLSSFLSSDYLLGLLGYDTDDAQRRLGDGFYEQKLIQQAVLARTGQRYLDGLNSDEATFRYLMDNAVASKDALQLSVGVSLTAEQVAALTHDIVWMEEQEVAGEKVLVPVLYLAQGEGRLAPTGALIQGRELTLITGGTLANSGTLRATENLSAAATTVVNAGLMQAGERLSVLAADSLVNTRGGILSGRNVDLTTLAGDLINERTVTSYAGSGAGFAISGSLVDAASRIEAAQSLSLSAGQDLLNLGSVLSAGTDMQLSAGRDLLITSVEEINSRFTQDKRHTWSTASTTQLGAEVSAGGSLTAVAGNDLAVIASRVQAGGDVALLAGNDLTLAAAADVSQSEYHYKSSRKKINAETLTVRQQAAEVEAGGSLTLAAGQDLTLVASAAQAGDEAYLYAGRDLELLAAENQDYFLYDKKKKGSLGAKKTQRDEITTLTQVGSRVEAGGNLTLESGEDQRYQVAKLSSGADLTLDAGGDISFEGVKDLKQESHEKSSSNWAWTSAKGKGRTDETLRQSELVAAGNLVIEAAGKIRIDIPEVNAQTVTQTIDALVEAEPKLAWLKEMESRGDIDWQRVKEVHDQWKYSHSGMGAGLAIIVAIVIAIVTYGAASGAIGTAATTTTTTAAGAGAAAGTASTASAWAVGGWANAAASASLAGMASNTAVQLGTTGKVDWGQVLKTGAVSAITAGVSNYGFFEGGQSLNSLAGLSAAPGAAGSTTATSGLSFSWDQVYGVMGRGVVNASVSSAIQGTDFKDGFINSVVGDYAALGANSIGSLWGNGQNPVMQTLAHAALGAGAAGLTGRDAVAGAIGGLVESGLDNTLGQSLRESGTELGKWDKLAYMVAAMVAGGVAAEAVGHDGVTAAQTAQNAAVNNYLTALQLAQVEEARHQCAGDALCEAQVIESAQNLSRKQDFELTIAKIMCAVGTCERLDFMTSAIDQGNDPVSVQQYLQERYQNLPADVVAGAVDYYRAGALESLEDSTWNVVDSTLHFSGAVGAITGPLAVGAKATKEFGSEALLLSHFEKHGAEFGAKNVDEYMQIGRDIMQNGQKVEYLYKGEIRTGFVQFMGNRASGQAKFGFVGTNADGAITTIHVESGNSFWKLMSGSYLEKIIYPK